MNQSSRKGCRISMHGVVAKCSAWSAILAVPILVACGPSDQQRAEQMERRRIDCLDKICDGDSPPKVKPTEVAMKLDGRYFIAPGAYAGFGGEIAFYWPSKTPMAGRSDKGNYPERGKRYYDVAIEIFLYHRGGKASEVDGHANLRRAEADGRVLQRSRPRPGLEIWRIQDEVRGLPPVVWYVATDLKDPLGFPPVLACREGRADLERCSAGFPWRRNIVFDMRFSSKHGSDWPEIYQETMRVLDTIREE